MKHLIIVALIISIDLTSCKKNDLSKSELIGTWLEAQPCFPDSNKCYLLQFTASNQVYESSPFHDTSNYLLMDNNTMQLANTIIAGPYAVGSKVYQVSLSGNELTIKSFYTPAVWAGIGPPPTYDVHLNKQ